MVRLGRCAQKPIFQAEFHTRKYPHVNGIRPEEARVSGAHWLPEIESCFRYEFERITKSIRSSYRRALPGWIIWEITLTIHDKNPKTFLGHPIESWPPNWASRTYGIVYQQVDKAHKQRKPS